ncbi:MAG: ABC transporter ATP-binding protein, partial [Caldilineaceae bacterium]|nr:ABC transporter ATP-binding protein [Caldilineaceae bacterium]
MDKLLEVEHLTKTFTLGSSLSRVKITAVDDISFHIGAGEIFALAGESGCGKTTTARIIMGFEHPTSGVIIHSGKKEVTNKKVWFTEGIQAIFQDPFSTFNPLRPVERYFFDTVRNYKLARGGREAIDYIDAKLRLIGMSYEDISGRYPSEFSGGQLQRISIARALLTNPQLIIADEPVSMVDASLRATILESLSKLNRD